MNTPMKLGYLCLVIALPVAAWGAAAAAKAPFDVPPLAKRQATVDLAQSLAARKTPPPVKADLPSPFSPADFDKAEPVASGPAPVGGLPPPVPAGGRPGPAAGQTPAQPAAPVGDRSILEAVAARIPALGMLVTRDGKPMLAVTGGKRFEIGTKFTVSYDNQDYELEVVAIDRTTFTLRYRGEEITRPIRLAK